MRITFRWLTPLVIFALLLSACGGGAAPATSSGGAATTAPASKAVTNTTAVSNTTASAGGKDLLADILARGVLRISTDPAYPPQSELVEGAKKPTGSKCQGEEHAVTEFKGFDIDVAAELAKRLGVEPCFVTPDWTLITGGKWSGRWDISVGSVTITVDRMKALYFSQPYYTTPAAFFVHKDNKTFTKPEDLSGKKIGVCSDCSYDHYLNNTLEIPGETVNVVVKNADIHGYDTDTSALQDLTLGDGVRLDGVMTAIPTGQGFIKAGKPIKQLGDAVLFEYLAPAFDRSSPEDNTALRAKVDELIKAMHSDGTLKKLSEQDYGIDLATKAAEFDISKLKQ
ncbi:MAG: transporter substrate-binding domain-containing protein [Caldilineaceae bacterium]